MHPAKYEGDIRLIYLRIADDGTTQVLRARYDALQDARERFDRLRAETAVKAVLVLVDSDMVLVHGPVGEIAPNFRVSHFGVPG